MNWKTPEDILNDRLSKIQRYNFSLYLHRFFSVWTVLYQLQCFLVNAPNAGIDFPPKAAGGTAAEMMGAWK